ncbi:hypothetical protein J4462_02670 [Candidatus Pacearchaeota archaeon]|nr:hypothetical protein [Candidatus Pacearchaeota archaeon]
MKITENEVDYTAPKYYIRLLDKLSEPPHSKLLHAGKSAYGRTWVPNDDIKSTSLSWSTFLP